jgi:hypothetical protein
MKGQTLNEMLLEAFPELTEDFKAYVEWQDGIDTSAFLWSILCEYLPFKQ